MDAVAHGVPVDLRLPAHVRACRTSTWFVFLDLKADRYWALPATTPVKEIEQTLGDFDCAGASVASAGAAPSALMKLLAASPDALIVLEAALWADQIVKKGRLHHAFAWLEANKGRVTLCLDDVHRAHDRFEKIRAWVPVRYVCLFNSLALMRFLTWRNVRAELVFGVRAMPFAAHCWVVASGEILDPGEEDCSSFVEIARV